MLDFPEDKEVLSYCAGIPWLFNVDMLDIVSVQYTLNPDNTVNLAFVCPKFGFLCTFGINLLLGKQNPLLGKVDISLNMDIKTNNFDTSFAIYNLKNFKEYTALMGFIAMNKHYFASSWS